MILEDNVKDLVDILDFVKNLLEIILVFGMEEVFKYVLVWVFELVEWDEVVVEVVIQVGEKECDIIGVVVY